LGFSGATHRTLRECFVHFFKSGALRVAEPRGLSALGVSLLAFFAPMPSKKAAKKSWYQRLVCLCNAFFFGTKASKKKAWQKRNGVLQACAACTAPLRVGRPLLKKRCKTIAEFVRT
jgi:hypothetical protein